MDAKKAGDLAGIRDFFAPFVYLKEFCNGQTELQFSKASKGTGEAEKERGKTTAKTREEHGKAPGGRGRRACRSGRRERRNRRLTGEQDCGNREVMTHGGITARRQKGS